MIMDMFGIGTTIKSMIGFYCASARATGRTNAMIQRLKTNDFVVFTNKQEALRVSKLCKERGVDIFWGVSKKGDLSDIYEMIYGRTGRVVLDHNVITSAYQDSFEHTTRHLNDIQRHFIESENISENMVRREFLVGGVDWVR